jgi:GDP-L-fucose synthase
MNPDSRIYVAGHGGLVGSAICRRLLDAGYASPIVRTSRELDLRDPAAVREFFAAEKPEYIFLAAARVGGILANSTRPAEFIYDNLAIEMNVIHAAQAAGVKKLQLLGSSCIYPKFAPQPIHEDALLSGPLEPTNEWYAVAKIAGIKMAQAYRKQYGFRAISLMPTNLYGPGDNFDLTSSHVVPALLRKFREAVKSDANEVEIWGTGSPRREFLHVDDLAGAALFLMLHYDREEIVNVGTGEDVTIRELAELIGSITGFRGRLVFDASKPDGTPRKLLDVTRLNGLGWKARIPLVEGIRSTYEWYLSKVS